MSREQQSHGAAWARMEASLRRVGQDHVLTPPPPPQLRDAFLAQLESIDLDVLPKMLATSLTPRWPVRNEQSRFLGTQFKRECQAPHAESRADGGEDRRTYLADCRHRAGWTSDNRRPGLVG